MAATPFLTPEEQAQLNAMSGGGGDNGSPQSGDGSGFDDSFEFSTDGLDPNDVEKGAWLDKEGQYHFEISDIEFGTSKNKGTPFVELKLVVLHTVPGQCPEGTRFSHQSYLSEGARGMTTLLGHRIGALKLVPTGELDAKGQPEHHYVDAKTGQKNVTKATWLAVKGGQFVGFVKLTKERTDKNTGVVYGAKLELVGGKCWPVDHQEVADVPKNLQAMKLIGKTSAVPAAKTAPPATSTSTKAPPAKPPKTPPTAAPSVPDDLSDL